MKKKKRLKNLCVLLLFLVCISAFFPWLRCGDGVYSLLEFYKEVYVYDHLKAMAEIDNIVYLLPYFLIFPVLVSLLSGVKGILFACNINLKFLSHVIYGLEFVYVATYFAFGGYLPYPAAFVGSILTFVEFMVEKYAQDYEGFTKEWKKQKVLEQKEKEERKRRLDFPGKYAPALFKLMWERTKHQKKAVILIHVGNNVLFGAMLVLLSLKQQFQKGYGITDALPSQGLNGILKNALIIVVFFYVLFEIMALYHYASNQKNCRRMLWVLGAREQLQVKIQVMEYGMLIGVSFVEGCLFGTLCYGIVAGLFNHFFAYALPLLATVKSYLITSAIYLLVACITAFVVTDTLKGALQGERKKEKKTSSVGKKHVAVLGAAGILVFLFSLWEYSQRRNAESFLYLLAGLGGGFLLLFFAFMLDARTRNGKRSESFIKVMDRMPLQRHFFQNTSLKAGLFLLHFVFFSILSLGMAGILAAPEEESLFPYDYVCMAYEDDRATFESLEQDKIAVVQSFPMTRVTTVQGDATDWADIANNYYINVIWPQGQHIGISESVYRSLCEAQGIVPEELQLKKDQIHVVYQQDLSVRAHPLDWYLSRKKPYLRVGQPLHAYPYVARERLYPPREVKSEERRILTGVFQGGMQEDLVVFSDEYFGSLKAEEGPTRLYLIRGNEKGKEEIEKRLEAFRTKHEEDTSWSRLIQPYYSGAEKVKDVERERMLQKTALLLESILLLMCVFLTQIIKVEMGRNERTKKYRLLFYLGTRQEECRKLMRREFRKEFLHPVLWAFVVSILLVGITCHLRMMSAEEIRAFGGYLLILWGVYGVIQWLFFQRLYRGTFRQVRKM